VTSIRISYSPYFVLEGGAKEKNKMTVAHLCLPTLASLCRERTHMVSSPAQPLHTLNVRVWERDGNIIMTSLLSSSWSYPVQVLK